MLIQNVVQRCYNYNLTFQKLDIHTVKMIPISACYTSGRGALHCLGFGRCTINVSLQEGIVPFEWKEANIIPLFKKGSRNKYVNYRPVSLTSVICKVLETIIRDHMMDFLIKH